MDLFLFLSTIPLLKEIVLFIQTGGLLLWPLIILSLFMWVLITEKFINLALGNSSTKKTTQRDSVPKARQNALEKKRKDFQYYLSKKDNERLFRKNIDMIRQCIVLAPLLGLLGTVTGMIEVFEVLKIHGSGNSILIVKGFSHATIPTMFGLTVAIFGFFSLLFLEDAISHRLQKDNNEILKVL